MNAPTPLIDRPERLRLSVEEFLLLAENGSFAGYSKAELIDGDIYVMNSQLTRHARAKSRLFGELLFWLRATGSDLEAIVEVAVRVASDSLLEPDLVLTRFQGDREMPAESVALVIEVSGTTLDTDLGRKALLYAAAGVPEYWVVDLNDKRVLVHDDPAADGYRGRLQVPLGSSLRSMTIDGLAIDTAAFVE